MKRILILAMVFLGVIFTACQLKVKAQLVDYVDPRIGTIDDESHCVIGPQLPFGSINPSPQTPLGMNDGYNPNQPIRGFGQLHVSGTGWGKYGQVFVSPQIGLAVGEKEHDSPKSNEIAKAYEYGVTLNRYNIRTEFTPSFHSAVYRFIFPESDSSNVLLDLSHHLTHDIATYIGGTVYDGTISINSKEKTISGYGTYEGGFGEGRYPVYFIMEFDRLPQVAGTWKNGKVHVNQFTDSITIPNDRVGAYFNFHTSNNDTVMMKVGVSFKSIERAKEWLNAEVEDFNFEKVKLEAREAWNNELKKIQIEGASEDRKTIFYTAMYHSHLMPRNKTNDMHGFDDGVPVWDDHFAIWDTWRASYPLFCLIDQDVVSGTVNSFIARYKKNHIVRDAFIAGIDMSAEQGGNNVDNVIAEAYLKNIPGVDWEEAYKVVKANADENRGGFQGMGNYKIIDKTNGQYKEKGWIPAGIMSCSYTLEYCYNDYCASEIASGLGKTADAKKYFNRSTEWVNLWNQEAVSDGFHGFIVPKDSSGNWVKIDLKKNWGSWKNYFYEGSSWTYSYFVPHQFPRLIQKMGGKETYVKRLDYAMQHHLIDYSNEPAFLAAHSFIYAGRPDLASLWVRKLATEGYTLEKYPGNEDSGTMSAWYIFSTIGLFPNAGQDIYYLFGSMYPKTVLTMSNGKQLIIEAENASVENKYVQSCTVNKQQWNKAWLLHSDIENGAVIHYIMGSKPSVWATGDTTIDSYGMSFK